MFATNKVNPKGKVVKVYKHEDVKTPLEALALLNKLGLVKFKTQTMLADLLAQAKQKTDLAAAQEMQQAKHDLVCQLCKTKTTGLMHVGWIQCAKKGRDQGGACGGLAGARFRKIPARQNFQNSRVKGSGK